MSRQPEDETGLFLCFGRALISYLRRSAPRGMNRRPLMPRPLQLDCGRRKYSGKTMLAIVITDMRTTAAVVTICGDAHYCLE